MLQAAWRWQKRGIFLLSFADGFHSFEAFSKRMTDQEIHIVTGTGEALQIIGDASNLPIIERHFAGHTQRDLAIQALPLPTRPRWLNWAVRLLRWYRRRIAHRLGNRCVCDPSCSHYAEMAFRQKGILKGLLFTIRRLKRCRPGKGGVDELL